eukprot:7586179-Pyramimonas_sp.AAC.1
MGDKAWEHVCSQSKSHDYLAVVESHVPSCDVGKWTAKARGSALKLFANGARPKAGKACASQVERANEGGEWLLARGHRPAQVLDAARAAKRLRAERGGMFDGCVGLVGCT